VSWTVEFGNAEVREELEGLALDMQAKFFRIAALIGILGGAVREPHVKALGRGLFEMRMSGRDGIARALYVVRPVKRVVVVLCFVKKTEKIPHGMIELALRRAKEVK